jgi:protein-S-isoprenylcysteine O-methyltransferase Ste14
MKKLGVLLSLALYDCVAVLLLYNRVLSRPWSRLDLFSGFYLAAGTTLGIQQLLFAHRLSPSSEIRDVFFAKQIQPQWNRWVAILGLLEWGVFYDYGHLHTARTLEFWPLQTAGVLIYICCIVWLYRVDSYLLRNFVPKLQSNAPMTDGPYRLMRHPRYAGLLGTRLAFPLLLPSVLSWALALCWFFLVAKRVDLEEEHLSSRLGPLYEAYIRQTPKLLPIWPTNARRV